MDGPNDRVIPGNALSVHNILPYHGLDEFGVSFLNRLEGIEMPSPALSTISLIDTPGILSGEKQRHSRGYDFAKVTSWFAHRSDLIIVLFDAYKLDISDELKEVIDALKPNHDKMRCVLNKADQVRQYLQHISP